MEENEIDDNITQHEWYSLFMYDYLCIRSSSESYKYIGVKRKRIYYLWKNSTASSLITTRNSPLFFQVEPDIFVDYKYIILNMLIICKTGRELI